MDLMKLREIPYKVRKIGNGGIKIKIPEKWAAVHGWETGDFLVVGYSENKVVISKKITRKFNQVGRYKAARDYTIFIPQSIREATGLAENDSVTVYSAGDILIYEKVNK